MAKSRASENNREVNIRLLDDQLIKSPNTSSNDNFCQQSSEMLVELN